tara:strand:+ start:244 stop:1119 length:876 start_codon:yes stop_codon:yes gene_type:complete
MHISLDSALGRPRLLNSGGDNALEIAPNAAAAYSLRSLTSGDPTVVRVRRDTGGGAGDNDEQDFTASGISSGALVSFVGSGNDGFVETWYDQSGNSRDLIQATASNQPQIVDAGSLLNELTFNATSVHLKTAANFDVFGANSLSFFSVINPSSFSGNPRYLSNRSGTPGVEFIVKDNPKLYYKDSSGNGTGGATESASIVKNTDTLYTSIVDRDTDQTVKPFKNGSAVTISSPPDLTSVGSINSAKLSVGANNTGGSRYNGKTKELIIYASNQEAKRTALETNINDYYSIF